MAAIMLLIRRLTSVAWNTRRHMLIVKYLCVPTSSKHTIGSFACSINRTMSSHMATSTECDHFLGGAHLC